MKSFCDDKEGRLELSQNFIVCDIFVIDFVMIFEKLKPLYLLCFSIFQTQHSKITKFLYKIKNKGVRGRNNQVLNEVKGREKSQLSRVGQMKKLLNELKRLFAVNNIVRNISQQAFPVSVRRRFQVYHVLSLNLPIEINRFLYTS